MILMLSLTTMSGRRGLKAMQWMLELWWSILAKNSITELLPICKKKQLRENVHLFIFTQFLLCLQDLDSHIFAPMTLVMTRSSCREQMGRSPAPSTRCCTSDLPSWSCSPRRCSQTLEVLKMVWYYFSNNDIGNWLVLWCWNDCSFKISTSIMIYFNLNTSTLEHSDCWSTTCNGQSFPIYQI